MACCINRPYILCSVDPCGEIVLPNTVQHPGGVFRLAIYFLGSIYNILTEALEPNEQIIFSLSGVNEYQELQSQIFNSDNQLFEFTIGSNTYDGIQFETKKQFQL